jgi:uncharacterized protein
VYHPVDELREEEHHEVAADELDMDFYTGDELDIQTLINEQIVLALPMKPLCREECRGLCPECGTNFNIASCECRPAWVDPRLAVLDQLRKDK